MATKKNSKDKAPVIQDAELVDPQLIEAAPKESPIKAGFTVGVREDNKFVFELLGVQVGAVELMGIQAYADRQINNLVMQAVNDPTFTLLTRLKELSDALLPKQSD